MPSPPLSPPPKTRPKRPPGPAYEVMIWRLTPKAVGRGDKRTLVDNIYFEPNWEVPYWATRSPGAGRYRIEFRDAKRALVRVRYADQTRENQWNPPFYTVGRTRPPGRRKVRLPVYAYDSQTPTIEQERRHKVQAQQRSQQPRVAQSLPARQDPPQQPRQPSAGVQGAWQQSGSPQGASRGPQPQGQHPVAPSGAPHPTGPTPGASAAPGSPHGFGGRPPVGPGTPHRR